MPNDLQKMKTGGATPPVIENPKGARMTDRAVRPRSIGGKTVLMPAEPRPIAGRAGRMVAFDQRPASTRAARPQVRGDMLERKTVNEPTTPQRDGYVRLRLRVRNGDVSVVGAAAVPGPFVEERRLHGDFAYEVAVGGKSVAVGSIVDAGERRSFPNPNGPPEQREHFVTHLPTYEVNVRVPARSVSMSSLTRLSVKLYRIKEELPHPPLRDVPLAQQFSRQLREVAGMKGVKPDALAEPVRAQLRKALR